MNKFLKVLNKKLSITGITIVSAISLTGCLTSPYYGQILESKSAQVPFQLWTLSKDEDVTLECAKASAHGSKMSNAEYQIFATITPSDKPHYDYKNSDGDSVIYQASTKVVIPEECWRFYDYTGNDDYITNVRITQGSLGDKQVFIFDREGLGCFGDAVGRLGFFGWSGQGCEKRFINTGKQIKTIFLKARLR